MSSPALPARGGPGEAQPSLETMERRFRALVGGLLALAVSSCLFFAVTSKLEADEEHEITATWSPIAARLYQQLSAAGPSEEGGPLALRGPLLPIRVDEYNTRGRVDTRVFLALPPELRPSDPQQPPVQVAVLRYEELELRHYGRSGRGGDLTRERQGCQLLLYDVLTNQLVGERRLECPDPLPKNYGDRARLIVQPEQILAALRELER